MSGLSEILLRDLRVMDSKSYLIDLGDGGAAEISTHGHAVLHVVLSGSVQIGILGEERKLQLAAGECATCFYGDHHSLDVHARTTPQLCSLSDEFAGEDRIEHLSIAGDALSAGIGATVLSTVFRFAHVSPAAYSIRAGPNLWRMGLTSESASSRALEFNPRQILEECEGLGASGVIASFAHLLLIRSVRNMHRSLWNDQEMPVWAPGGRRIGSAVMAIHAQPEREWTVASLAREVGLSRSCFASAFAARVGVTPMTYLTQVRMQRAAQLLQSRRFAVAEVSQRVGYHIPSSFTRAFTSYHGMSPSLFAQENKTTAPTAP